MAIAVLNGLMLLGYQEREGRDDKTYHSVVCFDGLSGENVQLDLDAPPNGNAIAPGTPVEVQAEVVFKRTVVTGQSGPYVGRGTTARFRVVSMKADKATTSAQAA